jgi:hypothetical protein
MRSLRRFAPLSQLRLCSSEPPTSDKASRSPPGPAFSPGPRSLDPLRSDPSGAGTPIALYPRPARQLIALFGQSPPGPFEARLVCLKQLGWGLKVVAVLAPRPVLSNAAASHDRPSAFPSIFPSMSASTGHSTACGELSNSCHLGRLQTRLHLIFDNSICDQSAVRRRRY